MSAGFRALSSAGPSPHASSVPGLKFSTRMSAESISRATSARSAAARRSSATDRLFREMVAYQRL